MNGRLVPWDESRIHVNSDAVLRGASVFEGLRAYRSAEGEDLFIFRLEDHLDRLFDTSMRVLRMRIAHTRDQLGAGVVELLRANEVRDDAHIRVVAYFDVLDGPAAGESDPTGVYMLALPKPASPKLTTGVRTTISAWRRPSDNAISPRVKASANYINSRVAMLDANLKGFDIPVLLNERGKVSEGPGQNIFLVRRGRLVTPRITDAILEGITRETVIDIGRELGLEVEEREVDATELYVAEELFFAGTAMEVQPIVEIDSYVVSGGVMGTITASIQQLYLKLVRGAARRSWLTSVHGAAVRA
ncbi:MAG: branched-chain-amino-acid transaminase [Candidatus Dormibacteraeota bacterium]|nr:branched-chain-amino-acid transaminase [Candidatus Dormibacteraeota bacterium]